MPEEKKTIFLLDIDDYETEITGLTYPLFQRYAEKIGATIHLILDRKFPDMPIPYEKFQIYELARELDSDWNIYFDMDTLIHPSAIDFTELIDKGTVLQYGFDMGLIRWKYDNYFHRDARNIGTCGWCTIASDWCLDLWSPLDMPLEEALSRCYPTQFEVASGLIDPQHLLDDFVMSRNLARYGLRYNTIPNLIGQENAEKADFLWHKYAISPSEKLKMMKDKLRYWHVTP